MAEPGEPMVHGRHIVALGVCLISFAPWLGTPSARAQASGQGPIITGNPAPNPEQIHSLINTMDDVADLIQDSAETMALYDVRVMTEEITRLTDLSVKCWVSICWKTTSPGAARIV